MGWGGGEEEELTVSEDALLVLVFLLGTMGIGTWRPRSLSPTAALGSQCSSPLPCTLTSS